MPVPVVPTFDSDGVIPSSSLSALADAVRYALRPPTCIATRAAVQSLTTGVAALVSFDTEVFDNFGMFAPTSTTITISDTAVYQISGWVDIAPNASGIRVLEILQNGNIVCSSATSAPSAGDGRLNVSTPLLCLGGDTITLQAFQNSGGSLNVTAGRLGVVFKSAPAT